MFKTAVDYPPLTPGEQDVFRKALQHAAYCLSHHHPEAWTEYIGKLLDMAESDWYKHHPDDVAEMYALLEHLAKKRLQYLREGS